MMDKQGDDWNNYGALDEENTESAHAKMNNVSRLFGASRGPTKEDDYQQTPSHQQQYSDAGHCRSTKRNKIKA